MTFDDELNQYYAENGKVFTSLHAAMIFLKKRGFYKSNGMFRNDHGRKAFLTKVKDYNYGGDGKKWIDHVGWLVTLGGNPISYVNLKLSSVIRDL